MIRAGQGESGSGEHQESVILGTPQSAVGVILLLWLGEVTWNVADYHGKGSSKGMTGSHLHVR